MDLKKMQQESLISADFPFESHYLSVFGHNMHYIEMGQGDPILFLHSIPTWSYVWRNVIPSMAQHGRCIALDLIGMGRSAKPDISYQVFDHIAYVEEFIETLGLTQLTIVMHGWGSAIGFDYAMRHEGNIKALAFFEAYLQPIREPNTLALPVDFWTSLLSTADGGFKAVMEDNYFIEKVLPWSCIRRFSPQEMQFYQEPFREPSSRRVLWQYLQDLPLGDRKSERVLTLIDNYANRLTQSKLPKLLMYAVPGFITPIAHVAWAKQNLNNLTIIDLGDALHYPQESEPLTFTENLLNWYTKIA